MDAKQIIEVSDPTRTRDVEDDNSGELKHEEYEIIDKEEEVKEKVLETEDPSLISTSDVKLEVEEEKVSQDDKLIISEQRFYRTEKCGKSS